MVLGAPLAAGAIFTGAHLVRLAREPNTPPAEVHIEWMPAVNLHLSFRLGAIEALFATLVLAVGFLVLVYCSGYFVNPPRGKRRRISVFASQMIVFAASMYGLVISDNLLLMFIFWELTSVLSFLLVGYYSERASSRRSAGQALMVTTLGGLVMLVGIILLGVSTGHWALL